MSDSALASPATARGSSATVHAQVDEALLAVLGEPVRAGRAVARNRLVFGPHETNLARGRRLSDRHVAYYRRRAAGGAGVIVTEEASVHETDWPYERAPFAPECGEGWSAVARSCHDEGALVVAALGHAGGQGSSAYHQRELWAPSSVPDIVTREVPKVMEAADIDALVAAFAAAAALAVDAGCDGVEVNAGQFSLARQFCSGLTNLRGDEYGSDRSLFVRRVLRAVRASAGGAVLGLRFAADELAPWAGMVPESAAELLAALCSEQLFDYVTVVRGSAYQTSATRPDGHTGTGFNREATRVVRQALGPSVTLVAQGSIVEARLAAEIVSAGEADLVEMTRAQIADGELASKIAAGSPARVRPCVLCNQACQVRDPRNPLVSCIGDPRSGYEWEAADALAEPADRPRAPGSRRRRLLVVGSGPAGLECARVAALGGLAVTVVEREEGVCSSLRAVASRIPGRERLADLAAWLEAECRLLGVEIATGHETTLEELDANDWNDWAVVVATGSRPGRRSYEVAPDATVLFAGDVMAADLLVGGAPPSPAVVWDPIGGPIGVGVAELLARLGSAVSLVSPHFVAGEQLARSGDLAPANARLHRLGAEIVRNAIVRLVEPAGVVVEDRFSGERRTLAASLLVDAGQRLSEDSLARSIEARRRVEVAGDAVAPRSILEAVLEGRRSALRLVSTASPDCPPGLREPVPA